MKQALIQILRTDGFFMKKHGSLKKESGYTLLRYNSLNHSVLSHLKVLPWESQEDFDKIQAGFLQDYQPVGATETYLVFELANMAFRRQRLYLAENALITDNLHQMRINMAYHSKTAWLL